LKPYDGFGREQTRGVEKKLVKASIIDLGLAPMGSIQMHNPG
jgi:hypothetical protein